MVQGMKRLIFAFTILFSINTFAFKFSPMSASLDFKGAGSNTLFYVENDSSSPIAIQMSFAKREMNEMGEETNSAIGNELTLYPSQLILQPNEKRSIKVSWTGKQSDDKELAYRLIAEQLPLDLQIDKKKKSNIKILLRYVAALYVTDEKFSSQLTFKEIITKNNDLIFVVENSGNKHQILGNLELTFADKTKKTEIVLKGEELKGMIGENVLANSKRQFKFSRTGKLEKVSPASQVKMTFDKE